MDSNFVADPNQIRASYEGFYQNWDFDAATPLYLKPAPFSEDSASVGFILEYEKRFFSYLKKRLMRKYEALNLSLRLAYPMYSSLKLFLEDPNSQRGYVVAKILRVSKTPSRIHLELYDDTEMATGLTYSTYEHLENSKRTAQVRTMIDEFYKPDYLNADLTEYPSYPLLRDKTQEGPEVYCKKRYDASRVTLKQQLVLGFFVSKMNLSERESETTANQLQKTIHSLNIKRLLDIHLVANPMSHDVPTLKCSSNHKVVFCSDLHVGSFTACVEDLERLVQEINKDELIKYVIASGDLVDGINVYPNQKRDLKIKNFVEQYERLCAILGNLRPDIGLILIPGNHDFISKVEPQLWTQQLISVFKTNLINRPLLLLPNPTYFSIDGVKIYVTHGCGVAQLTFQIADFDIKRPAEASNFMLQNLNAMPLQMNAPMRATAEIPHAVPEDLNILNVGHMHNQESFRRNKHCVILCNGAFQNLTPYMNLMGLNPNVSCVWCVTLSNLELTYWDLKTAFTDSHTYTAVEGEIEATERKEAEASGR